MSSRQQKYNKLFSTGGLIANESVEVTELHEPGENWTATQERALSDRTMSLPKHAPNRRSLWVVTNRLMSYDDLFGPYLADATEIVVTDPYIRHFYQAKNFMELILTILRYKAPEANVQLRLITCADPAPEYKQKQRDLLDQIVDACAGSDIEFTWFFDETDTSHAHHIMTDTGWKISLDRGLDIFQHVGIGGAFNLAGAMQERRAVKAFEVTYIRDSSHRQA